MERLCEICNLSSDKWITKTKCQKCYNKEWHKNHPNRRGKEHYYTPVRRFKHGIRSAKQRNLVWIISMEDFQLLIKQPCYYCNNQLGKQEHGGSGLDRIDSSKGYELHNVLPCCPTCNLIKNTSLTVEETKVAVQAIIMYRKMNEVSL